VGTVPDLSATLSADPFLEVASSPFKKKYQSKNIPRKSEGTGEAGVLGNEVRER
jgi:hypothetical protein